MSSSLPDELLRIRDEVDRFARTCLNENIAERDRSQTFSHALWQQCGSHQLTGLLVSTTYGGKGYDARSTTTALEALGHTCEDGGLVFAICAHLLGCVVPLCKHGTEAQKDQFLPALANGSLIAANAMSEPHTGSDPSAMTTTAIQAGDGFVINGRKTFCTNGPVADVVLVYAKTNPQRGMIGGITAFLVNANSSGLQKGPAVEKMGLRTCTMSEIAFDNVRVSGNSVLGPVGAGGQIFLEAMDWERVCISAVHIGVMQRLLNRTVQFAKSRRAAGKFIGEFQAVSHRLANMKVNLEAGRLLTMNAAEKIDSTASASLAASMAKLFVSETLVKSALDTINTLGGSGFLTETGVERVLRDSVASTIYSGTSDIQRNIIAKWLGL